MNDTREKLERDIDRFLGSWTGWSISTKVLKEAILGWLDRQAAIAKADLQAKVDELEKGNHIGWECECRLQAERDNLARDLEECNRERERLRGQLGIALDHAHDMLALVDLEGEVVG